MPIAPNLLKAFEKGILKPITVRRGYLGDGKPPDGKAWLILNGHIQFTTGTACVVGIPINEDDTYTIITTNYPTSFKLSLYMGAAVATDGYPLFPSTTGFWQWQPIILYGSDKIVITGDVANILYLQVLEWTP